MGNLCIPKKSDTENNIDNVPVNVPQQEIYAVDDPDEYDRLAVEVLKSELKDDPETFILNQVLMCYMFFEDFTEEVRQLHHATSQKAQQLNSKLIQDQKKQFFMPDSILETVNKWVKFEYSSGPKKGALEPLASQRLIIIHDNVEVLDDIEGYTSIDKPHYRATVEESKDSTGFLKVNIFETAENFKNYKRSSGDSAYSAASTKYKKRKSILNPIFTQNGELPDVARNDSGLSTPGNSDPEYDYTRITAAQTPKNIDITEVDTNINIYQLPTNCIVKLKEKNIDLDSDDDDEDEDDDKRSNIKRMENNLFIYKYFLNSTEFMKHFQNTVFPNYIGELLGFSKNYIQDAKSIPGAMFCPRKDYSNAFWDVGEFLDTMIEFQVIPAISMPWLHSSAFEWVLRERPMVYDQNRLKPIIYKWPTAKMIDEAKTLHSIIVPKGFMPKKKENPQMHLEWEVQFPKIEKYLEFRMSHAQTRVFLYLIALFKKFIEPLTQKHGLSVEHLRFVMFWECEANYKDWMEDKLGKKIKAVLSNLYSYLGKSCLPHYFIKNKNVFENVPRKYLISNQEIIHDILESPVSYFLTALKDLRYYSERFYPLPDIEELEDILSSENVLSNIPIAIQESALQKQKREFNLKKDKDSRNRLDKEQLWYKKFVEMKRIDAQNQQENEEQRKKNLVSDRQELSLDVNINFKKKLCKAETARQILVFIYFIKQHIGIAQRSLKISSTTQTMFYLKQASYLTKLLDEIASESLKVKEYQSQITLIEKKCMKKMVEETSVPLTPKRNSSTLVFTSDILQVKGKDINMSKLNMAYNSTMFAKQGRSSTSNIKRKRTTSKNEYLEKVERIPLFANEAFVSEKNDNNNSRMTDLNGKDDVKSVTSDLENSNFENIEVIADVHNVTTAENQVNDVGNDLENKIEIENQKNDDIISLNLDEAIFENKNEEINDFVNDELENIIEIENQKKDDIISLNNFFDHDEAILENKNEEINDVVNDLENIIEIENQKIDNNIASEVHNLSEIENKIDDEKISLSDSNTVNNIVNDSEKEIEVENQKEDDDTISLNNMFDLDNQNEDTKNEENNNTEITLTNEKDDINSTPNDLEKSSVENIEAVADVENQKNNDSNSSESNSEIMTNTDQNNDVNDTTQDLKNLNTLDADEQTVPTTEDKKNDEDTDDFKNNPKIFLSQNGDVNESPNYLENPKLDNDEVVSDKDKVTLKKNQKNDDLGSSNKLINFSIGTFENRNKR